jgi:hypothetical protein
MIIPQRFLAKTAVAAALALLGTFAVAHAAGQQPAKPKRPKITIRSSPAMAFTPATLTFTAELKEGDNDFEEFYCAEVEWDWDDGTVSESSDDCEPYEKGKSEIRRRFTVQHKYNIANVYNVQFRLKQRGKVVAVARTRVTIKPGM